MKSFKMKNKHLYFCFWLNLLPSFLRVFLSFCPGSTAVFWTKYQNFPHKTPAHYFSPGSVFTVFLFQEAYLLLLTWFHIQGQCINNKYLLFIVNEQSRNYKLMTFLGLLLVRMNRYLSIKKQILLSASRMMHVLI